MPSSDVWGNRAVLTGPAAELASIPELFAGQVAGAPEAVAISGGGSQWTYRELMRRRIGWRTISLTAARPGRTVALFCCAQFRRRGDPRRVEDRCELSVARPAHPDARISFMLTDAAPIAAITDAELRVRLEGHDLPLIDSRSGDRGGWGGRVGVPAPDDIAYIIYTSGRRARRRVAIRIATQLLATLDAEVGLATVWTQCHSLAFDHSVWEGSGVRCSMAGGW